MANRLLISSYCHYIADDTADDTADEIAGTIPAVV